MHELGIVFHIADTVTRIAEENDVKKVRSVVLEIGEVSGIIDWYLHDCWKWRASKSELLNQSVLNVHSIQAITYCQNCSQTYPTMEHGRICPYCGSDHTYLKQGRETNILEIIADDPNPASDQTNTG